MALPAAGGAGTAHIDIDPRIAAPHEVARERQDRRDQPAPWPAQLRRAPVARLAQDRRQALALAQIGRQVQIQRELDAVGHGEILRAAPPARAQRRARCGAAPARVAGLTTPPAAQ
jgi:hypothetical protein